MRQLLAALFVLVFVPALSWAQTLVVGNAAGLPGSSAAPVPVAITLTNGTTTATAIRDIDARLTYDPAVLTVVASGNAPGSCTVLSPGNILVTNPDNGATPLADGVICNLTAISINASATTGSTPLTLSSGAGSGCTNATGAEIPCGYVSGAVTVLGVPTLAVGSAAGLPGTAAAPVPVTITLTNGTTAATAIRDIDARLTYDPAILTITVAGNSPGACSVLSPGIILVTNPDNGATPLADGVICNLTSIVIHAGATAGSTPLTLANGAGSGCTIASGAAIPCGYVSGSVTVGTVVPVEASLVVGSAAGLPGGAATPVPLAITFTNGTGAAAVRDIDARLTYDPTRLTIVAAGNPPGACLELSPGNILVTSPDNGATPLADGVICNLTAISINASAPLGPTPLTIASGAGSGCTGAAGNTVPCGYVSGAVTVIGGSTLSVGSASGLPGTSASPLPVAITLTNGTTAATAIRDIDARLTYDPSVLSITATGNAPGSCVVLSPGNILVANPDNGATPLPNGVICNLTAIAINPGAVAGVFPLTLANGAGSGCTSASGAAIPCGYASGAVTVLGGSRLTVGSAAGLPGTAATPVPVAITLTNGTTSGTAVRDLDARLTYDPEILTIVAAGNAPGTCSVLSPGNILVAVPDNGATPLANGVICNLTAIAISPDAPLGTTPLTLGNGAGSGCTSAGGTEIPCGYVSGAVTVGTPAVVNYNTPPATLTFPTTDPGANASLNVPVAASAGNTAPLQLSQCTIAGTHAAAFSVTAPVGASTVAAGTTTNVVVRFAPVGTSPASRSATLTCPTPNATAPNASSFSVALVGPVTAPAGSTLVVGSAAGPVGGTAAPVPVAITLTNGTAPETAVRDIDARLTYDPAILTIVAAGNAPGSCVLLSPGNILVSNPDNGATPLANGVICNLTAISISAGAAVGSTPLTIANGAGSGCTNAAGNTIPCGYVSGSVTVTPVVTYTIPPATLSFPTTDPGANVSLNVPVAAAAGNSAPLQLSQCTIAGTHATDFSVTAPVGATTVAPGTTTNVVVRFAPVGASPASRTATLTCPTPNATAPNGTSFSVALTGPVTPVVTYTIPPATLTFPTTDPGANVSLSVPVAASAGNNAALQLSQCTIAGTHAADFSVTAPVGASTVAAGTTTNVVVRFAPAGASPATRTATLTCPTPNATAPNANSFSVSLTGPVSPVVTYTIPPATLSFPTTDPGANVSLSVPVAAAAGNNAALQLSQCTIAGTHATDFSVTAPVGATTVAAGTTTNVVVRFAPVGVSPASRTATLTCPTPNATAPNAASFSVSLTGTATVGVLNEDFAIVPGPVGSPLCTLSAQLAAAGWFARNNAIPAGTTCVFQGGSPGFPSAHSGTATSYAAMDFNNSTVSGDISTWFVTPRLSFGSGATLEFWTRGISGATHADSMQIRLSTAAEAGAPDVGTTPTSVGTFTTLLLDINPALTTASANCPPAGLAFTAPNSVITGYPLNDWCKITISGSALPSTGSGRIAFRYNPALGGPGGVNSNYVGIDTLSFVGTGPLPDAVFANGFE